MAKPEQISDDSSDDTIGSSGSTTAPSCTQDPTRSVFYGGSNVTQSFSCNQLISSLQLTGFPTFISGKFSGTAAIFTGTAPTTPADTNWSFGINSLTATTFKVKTTLLDPGLLSSSISPTISLDTNNTGSTSNNVEFDLGHNSTLDSSWDGSMTDVSLKAASIATDMAGMTLIDSCASATGSYVCNGTSSSAGLTVNSGLKMRWRWSAFDQGSYYLDVTPEITIEGGNNSLSPTSFSSTIPIQSGGSIQVTAANNPHSSYNYDSQVYRYGLAVSSLSSPLNPIVGLLYTDNSSGVRSYFQRITVDRTALPGGGSSGITENGSYVEQTGADSQDFSVNRLDDGSWIVVGGAATTGSFDILFNKITDSTTAPAISGSSVLLTSFTNTTERALDIATTKPFSDAGTTKIGLAFVRRDTSNASSYLTVAKINPSGTNSGTILDDLNYGVTNTGGYSRFQMPVTTDVIDRVRTRWISEGSIGYFYVAYRQATNLKILKLRTQYSSGYNDSSTTVTSNAFSNSDTTSSNQQSLDLALGTVSGATVAAIVYRDNAGDCYFRRVDSSLQASAALKFGTTQCYNPSIHFAPSGRFVATYAEKQASPSTKYDIKTTEFTLGLTDTYSTPVVVVADLTTYPIKLVTDLYSGGNWMAVFYRLRGSPTLRFHGYHVPGR